MYRRSFLTVKRSETVDMTQYTCLSEEDLFLFLDCEAKKKTNKHKKKNTEGVKLTQKHA